MKMLQFGDADIENVLARMSAEEIDKLPFGAVQLDADGTILQYNVMEGVIAGVDPKAVIGKNFFTEVAPCTNTPRFKGAFDEGVRSGTFKTMIEYTFSFHLQPLQTPQPVAVAVQMVRVYMKSAITGETYWVFVNRL